jgi:large subunit ribosomal protein L17
MVTSLLEHERLMTTMPKAKEIRPLAEKMITLGKRDTLHARRQVHAYLLDDDTTRKVFDTLGPRFGDRPGGYPRIVRVSGDLVGDGAPRAGLEWVGSGLEEREVAV